MKANHNLYGRFKTKIRAVADGNKGTKMKANHNRRLSLRGMFCAVADGTKILK